MTATVIDLSMPPSVNTIWRFSKERKKAYLSERYRTWKRDADNRFLANKRAWQPVKGHFRASITLSAERRRSNHDADNRVKVVLDWLQQAELIENDALCDGLTVKWGRAPDGCRVRIRAA